MEHDRLGSSNPGLDPVSAAFAAFKASAAAPGTATTTSGAINDHCDKNLILETPTMENEEFRAHSETSPKVEPVKYHQGYDCGGGDTIVGGAVGDVTEIERSCNLDVSRAETEGHDPEGIVEPVDSGGAYYDDFEKEGE